MKPQDPCIDILSLGNAHLVEQRALFDRATQAGPRSIVLMKRCKGIDTLDLVLMLSFPEETAEINSVWAVAIFHRACKHF